MLRIVPIWIDIKCPRLFIVVVIAIFLVSTIFVCLTSGISHHPKATGSARSYQVSVFARLIALLNKIRISFKLKNLHIGIAAEHAIASKSDVNHAPLPVSEQ